MVAGFNIEKAESSYTLSSEVDSAGHKYGNQSVELNNALTSVDKSINYLLCLIKKMVTYNNSNFIIV